jgi:Uncharacterized enzyme involved in biosynthesis of extracellular polysaccharides
VAGVDDGEGKSMYVVIFRARVRTYDDEYEQVALRMRDLALSEFGCLAFHAVAENGEEIALSYWPDEASIAAWKNHPEHVLAQRVGRERWYESYSVEVAQIARAYKVPA